MKEFDYDLDYKNLILQIEETRKLYRIGRGEQGVLLVRPYTNDICAHWRFVNETIARKSADKIYSMFCDYKEQQDFIGMDMARKFLEMGFTRARRYANHPSGKKYASDGSVSPQSPTALHCEKSRSATVFKKVRDKAAYDETYQFYEKRVEVTGMTELIGKDDPRFFGQTCNKPYDRHHYKMVCKIKSFVLESWDEVQEYWWNNIALQSRYDC